MEENKKYEVTVVVASYYPDYTKMIETLDSILKQKEVSFQIVVADDGSKENLFSEVEAYLKNKSFSDYKLCALPENKGTVRNVLNGIENSDAGYVKTISPGDLLYGEHALRKWLDALKASENRKWSFCDIVCYHKEGNEEKVDVISRHPRNLKPYVKKKDFSCRMEYLWFSDNANGACILCERDFILEYLRKIDGIITYAEDNLWRMAMYDGFVPLYCANVFVKYECGSGISTSGESKWQRIISDEWNKTTEMILNNKPKDFAQRVLAFGLKYNRSYFVRGINRLRGTKTSSTIDYFPESE